MDYTVEELSIEVTNECNLACIHCSSGSTPKKLKDELTPIEHITLIADAAHLGATVLSLSGGNPLLYDNITALIEKAWECGYKRVLLYTTGQNRSGACVFDHPAVWKLMDLDVTWIFSLHSHDSETNDLIMNRPGAWKEITCSIKWLKRMGAEVEIHMVPMHPNYRHIPAMRKLCEELEIDKLSLLRFVPQTRGKLNEKQLGMDTYQFAEMQALMHNEITNVIGNVELRLGCPIDFRHACGFIPAKAKPCHAGDDLILVRPNGNVHPCAAWKSLPVDSNVMEKSLHEIWETSDVFNAIREFKAKYHSMVSGCAGCKHLSSCMAGCPAQRLHAYGNRLADLLLPWSDPLCPIGHQLEEDENDET